MTRRVTAVAAGLALVACLPASASAAPFERLTEKSARQAAVRLARNVAHHRGVTSWYVSPAVKVRRTRIVFLYADRNRDDLHCTAKIIIEQTARTRSATLGGGRCAVVPDEVLAMEKATRAVIRAVRAKIDAVGESLNGYEAEVERCEGLVVPRARRADVDALIDAGSALAAFSPVFAQLDGFVTALQDIQPEDPDLVRGVAGWRRLLILMGALPRTALDSCPETRRWAANGYAPEAAPVDFAELHELMNAIKRQELAIADAVARLERLGVFPNTAAAFEPGGLFLRASLR